VHQFLREVINRLAGAQVEFVIVRGVSAVLQGAPITTVDLDICYSRAPDNITRLVAALAPLRPRPRGFPSDLPFTFDERTVGFGTNFTLEIEDENLDLLGEMAAIGGYEQVVGTATQMTIGDFKVKVLSLANLIATKQAAGRPKDLSVLPILKATLETQSKQAASEDESTGGS
jgi:hypothetical protein